MEESIMATLHIRIESQPDLNGTIQLPLGSGKNDYNCKLGKFVITVHRGFKSSGGGKTLNMSGRISISDVPENYGEVTFDGTYVKDGGSGSGGVSWTGSRPHPGDTDPWTSDVTIPVPKGKGTGKPKARAKSQTSY
jgi:hypothetical protein